MSVLGWAAIAVSVVGTAASITSSKKSAKAQKKAAQEAAYVEGSAPSIPVANELMIETIGDAATPEGAAPDFRQALEGSYGGDIYDTQEFGSGPQQEIPPELEALLMQQQMSGPEPTNVQFSSSGGPVGLPQDVYHFSVPKINQMQMDVDPGVRNVGNAMMAQMEANPGMGMVGASAADIDQMAAGGPVRPKKYQDGSEGGLDIFAMLDQRAEDEGRLTGGDMEREYLFDTFYEPSVEKLTKEELRREQQIDYLEANVDGIKDFELDKLRREWEEEKRRKEALPDIPPQAVPMSREVMKTILEKQGKGAKALHGIEQVLGRIMPRQQYSEKRGYDEGPLIQEQGLDFRSAPEERDPFAQYTFRDPKFFGKQLYKEFGPEESRLEKFLERIGNLDGERVKSLFKRKERPRLGPQMRNDGGSVRPKKYQDGDQVKGTDQSLRELKQMAKSRGISRIEELLGFRLPEGLGEQDIEDVLLNAGLGELGIPITKRGDNYSYARRLGEDSNINVSVNPDQKAVQLGFEKRFNTGGPVQPRRYQEGSEGGIGELYKKIPTNLRLLGEYLAGAESPITEKDFTTEELDVLRNQIVAQKINNEVLEDEYRKAGDADAVETFETTRGRTSIDPYKTEVSELPTKKHTLLRSYISGGSGAVDKGWEEALKSLNDPSYTVATSLGKYTAEDVDDGFRIRENYDFNRGSLDRPTPIQDIESFNQLKNLLTTMQATPEVVGETLANMIRSEPRAVDIRL